MRLKTDRRNPAAFRPYLPFVDDEAANIRLIRANDTDNSDGNDNAASGIPRPDEGPASRPSETSVTSPENRPTPDRMQFPSESARFVPPFRWGL